MRINKTFPFFLICILMLGGTLNAQETPQVKFGGALRFNYNYSDWKPENRQRGGDFGYDMFRINADAAYKQLRLHAEYRLYPTSSGGGMLKSGWVGYQPSAHHQWQIGLTDVPFGLLPYTSNSYFFNLNYYIGLEDDADMGLKYTFDNQQWRADVAFFKNSDLLSFGEQTEIDPSRYSYDVAGRNKETNQLNARLAYRFGNHLKSEIGASGMIGQLYNLDTQTSGDRQAYAIHYMGDYQRWNLKLQYSYYRFSPKAADGQADNIVAMAAYGAPYDVAAKADTWSAALSYTLPLKKGIINELKFYNDFSMIHKHETNFSDSYQNVTGVMLTAGGIYTYIDYVVGKNHAWIGDNWNTAFSRGKTENAWNTRFNINLGYYF